MAKCSLASAISLCGVLAACGGAPRPSEEYAQGLEECQRHEDTLVCVARMLERMCDDTQPSAECIRLRASLGDGQSRSSNGDRDWDGIADSQDECGSLAEDRDGFEDSDGCPDPDNDGDLVPDSSDRCPLEAAPLGADEDDDGCADSAN